MDEEESPFKRAADRMNAEANKISKGRVGTETLSEISYCLEKKTIGVYPQTKYVHEAGAFLDDGGLYFDRFPEPSGDPIELLLRGSAKWTDALSGGQRYRCFLVNARALEIFNQFNLGNVRFYNVVVSGKKNKQRDYTFIFICNHISVDDIDFSRSECFLVDMISIPIKEISVKDKADFEKKRQKANEGKLPGSERFSRIAFGKMQLLPDREPKSDIFGVNRLDQRIYVSSALRDAILDANITGLEFKPNTRLFV